MKRLDLATYGVEEMCREQLVNTNGGGILSEIGKGVLRFLGEHALKLAVCAFKESMSRRTLMNMRQDGIIWN